MFNWFKRNSQGKSILANWNIEDIPGFEKIYNPDSVQYVNNDGSKVIYFSVLTVSGNDLFPIDAYTVDPSVIEDTNGWKLKGAKKSKNQILVCVISGVNPDDIGWAKAFFDSIKPR
ncbi:hypothetical protein [Mucilaginibacter flavidus]|uniref:hypothetical protein n=1 Tax=Mucilaginibacter flavidus TaxID=2949309 RepID=UPI0020923339|nr:hypothetical protein [Mucilaginibacter flavidus]MCO5949407.1 hypothetical protein [Mucilaginibacter flavidus]